MIFCNFAQISNNFYQIIIKFFYLMKKFYTFLLWMIAAVVCIPVASAKTVTVKVDDPTAVYYVDPTNNYSFGSWDANNSHVFESDENISIPLSTNSGYVIKAITVQGSGKSLFSGSSTGASIWFSDCEDGDEVFVTTGEKESKILVIKGDPEKIYIRDDNWFTHRGDESDTAWNSETGTWTIKCTSDYGQTTIYSNDGYKLASVVDDTDKEYVSNAPATSCTISQSYLNYGNTNITVVAKTDAEVFDGHVVVNVDGDASKVALRVNGSSSNVVLSEGQNDWYFATANAFPVTLQHASNSTSNPEILYEVKLNGKVVTPVDRVYTFETLEKDDVIDIAVSVPEEDTNVSITFADDTSRDAVKYIYLNNQKVDLTNCASIAAKTGWKIQFNLDYQNYDLALTENGKAVNVNYGSYATTLLETTGYEFKLTATEKEPLKVTVICENYEHLIMASDYNYNNLYELTGIETELKIKPANTTAYFKADSGWYIKSKSNADTGDTYAYSSLTLTDGMTLFIEVEEFLRDKSFVLFTEPIEWNYLDLTLNSGDLAQKISLKDNTGYQVVNYNESDLSSISIYGYPQGTYTSPDVFINGVKCTNNWGLYPELKTLKDGDVVKVMSQNAPLHDVTYKVADDVNVKVVHDRVAEVDHTDAHQVHAGTEIHIIPVSRAGIKVKAGNVELVADSEGKFVHTVTAPVEIAITSDSTTSISDIDAASDDAAVDVYNLQGVCVRRAATAAEINTLPAGVYITTEGKKIIVK